MNIKRAIALGMAAVTVLATAALTGCGRDRGPVKTRRTNVYSGTELSLPEDIGWISQMTAAGERIYLIYDKTIEVIHNSDGSTEVEEGGLDYPIMEEMPVGKLVSAETAGPEMELPEDSYVTYESQTWLYYTDTEGTETGSYMIEKPEEVQNGYMSRVIASENGMLYLLFSVWDGERDLFLLYEMDPAAGTIRNRYDLTGISTDIGMEEGEYFYISNMAAAGDTMYITCEMRIIAYDLKTGTVTGHREATGISWINHFYAANEKIYYSGYVDGKGQRLFTMDMASGKTAEHEIMDINNYAIMGILDGKICFQDINGITAWDETTGETKEVLNYINCDIDSNNLQMITMLPGDRFCYFTNEWTENENIFMLTVLNRIPDEQMQEEVLLTIGSAYQDYTLRSIIIDFNRLNTGVRLNMKTYEQYDNEENKYTGAVTQLNAEMTMGSTPDILLLTEGLPVDSYFSKGYLVDLYPYMDDPELGINRAEYMENIFKASEHDGKLYSLIASFYLQIMAAKEEYVGAESGWTMKEMLDTIEAMPEGMHAFPDLGREYLQQQLLRYCSEVFVDWENSTTTFDSEEFIRLIEFLKSCPEKSQLEQFYDSMDPDHYDWQAEQEFYQNFEMRFFRDQALFFTTSISQINGYNSIYRTFAGDATLIGYPTKEEDSNGAVITPNLELAICAASPNKDSAWTFIKYLMSNEKFFQNTWAFTVSKTWLDKQLAESEEQYADWYYEYTAEDWERMAEQYSPEYLQYMKNSQIRYSLEQGQKVYDLVTGATQVTRSNLDLLKIIEEELSIFYGGGRSAKETANIIASRARVYVSENS